MTDATHNPLNNLQEDVIFTEKVKRVLVGNKGVMALLTLLKEFKNLNSQRTCNDNPVNNNTRKNNATINQESEPSSNISQMYKKESSELKDSENGVEQKSDCSIILNRDAVTCYEFLELLNTHLVELSLFEQSYLCNAFKVRETNTSECERKKNIRIKTRQYICSETFIYQLTNVNPRRKRVLEQAWTYLLHSANYTDSKTKSNTFALEQNITDKVNTYEHYLEKVNEGNINNQIILIKDDVQNDFVQSIAPYLHNKEKCAVNSNTNDNNHLNKCASNMKNNYDDDDRSTNTLTSEKMNIENDNINNVMSIYSQDKSKTYVLHRDEFNAAWAGVSLCVADDNVFEELVKSTFNMCTRHNTFNMGNSLSFLQNNNEPVDVTCNANQTYYVKDALNTSLGISTRAYNYSHMLRKFTFVQPLPDLDRMQIMQTTVQRTYKPFISDGDVKLADPLISRREQLMEELIERKNLIKSII